MNQSRRDFLKIAGKSLVGLTLFGIPQSAAAIPDLDIATFPYSFEPVYLEDRLSEYRLFREGSGDENHHFMSIITQDANGGIFAIRPHPDGEQNDNAWGSTLYLQPFLPGATLKNTIVNVPVVDNEADGFVNGITISASGKVCRGANETFGDWNFSVKIEYVFGENGGRIESVRAGRFSITLDDLLTAAGGDLNLLKLASNYLHNVPLLNGTIGDTGDMSEARISFNDRLKRIWVPPQGTTYPGDLTNILTLDVRGNYNQVDTLAQGHTFRIKPAYKPNMRIRIERLTSDEVRSKMILGTAYDESQSQNFAEDNVAILPLILASAPEKRFNFDITFKSTPFRYNSAEDWEEYE